MMTVVTIVLATVSCSNNDMLDEISKENEVIATAQKLTTRSNNEVKIVYHGETYETLFEQNQDSTVSYLNMEVQSLVEELNKNNPNLVTFLHPDGSIEFFDDKEDLEANKNRIMQEAEEYNNKMRKMSYYAQDLPTFVPDDPVNHSTEIHLYEKSLYFGNHYVMVREASEISNEKYWNFGTGTSSLIVHEIGNSTLVAFFTAFDCQGKSFVLFLQQGHFVAYGSSYRPTTNPNVGTYVIDDLSTFYFQGISGNWNDIICCASVSNCFFVQ